MYRMTMKRDIRRALRRLDAMEDAAKDFRVVFQWAGQNWQKQMLQTFLLLACQLADGRH